MSDFIKPHIIILFFAVSVFGILAVIPYSWLGNTETTRIIFDCLHFPAFWCFQLLTLNLIFIPLLCNFLRALAFRIFGYTLSASTLIVITTLGLIGSTVLLEIIQPYVGRSRDPNDLFLGVLGIIAATLHFTNRCEHFNRRAPRGVLPLTYFIFITICSYKLIMFYKKQVAVSQGFTFEQRLSTTHWKNTGEIPTPKLERYADTRDNYVMRGYKLDYPWTGSSFENRKTFDISNSSQLKLRFFNPGSPVQLEIRLDDENGEAIFPNATQVITGWNTLYLSLTSKRFAAFNKHKVVKISFYYATENGPNYYYVDDIHFFHAND